MIYKADKSLIKKIAPFFQDMHDTIILSCIQGHMGEAWVDDMVSPTMAQIIVGCFVFYGGDPTGDASKELLCNLPEESLVIVSNDKWKNALETIHHDAAKKFQRYAFKKNLEHLDINRIRSFLGKLPEGYELKRIDKVLANYPSLQIVSEDFTKQFDSIDDYVNRGIGFCILHEGKIVCGASSYSIYDGGIEIEIDTHTEYRRKGLATVAASALILYCLEHSIYPSWDAANLTSVALAEKLGYVLDHSYDTYYIKYKN